MNRRKKYQVGTIIGSGVLSLVFLLIGIWEGPVEGTIFFCESFVFGLALIVTLFSITD